MPCAPRVALWIGRSIVIVVMFEEGIRLSSECLEYLGKTELRLKKLSRDAAGKFELTSEEDEG